MTSGQAGKSRQIFQPVSLVGEVSFSGGARHTWTVEDDYATLHLMASTHHISVSTIAATSVQREVGTVIRRVAKNKEHLIIEYDGIPVAVIVPMADYERLMSKGEADLLR